MWTCWSKLVMELNSGYSVGPDYSDTMIQSDLEDWVRWKACFWRFNNIAQNSDRRSYQVVKVFTLNDIER